MQMLVKVSLGATFSFMARVPSKEGVGGKRQRLQVARKDGKRMSMTSTKLKVSISLMLSVINN